MEQASVEICPPDNDDNTQLAHIDINNAHAQNFSKKSIMVAMYWYLGMGLDPLSLLTTLDGPQTPVQVVNPKNDISNRRADRIESPF